MEITFLLNFILKPPCTRQNFSWYSVLAKAPVIEFDGFYSFLPTEEFPPEKYASATHSPFQISNTMQSSEKRLLDLF